MANELVSFRCGYCDTPLDVDYQYLIAHGNRASCVNCKGVTEVTVVNPAANMQRYDDPSVNMRIGMPGGPGFESQVSRSDAGKIGFTAAGAAIAIVGAIFGINLWNRRS